MTWTLVARSEDDTHRLGLALGAVAEPGCVVALHGELGAGKTRLVRAVVEGGGGRARDVSSPTFVLLQHYEARLPIHHADAFRIGSLAEFLDLGIDEWLDGEGLSLVEWADRVGDVLPEDHLVVAIEITGVETREFTLTPRGPRSQRLLDRLQNAIDND